MNVVLEYWQVFLTLIGSIIFVVRTESKTSALEKEATRLQNQRDADQVAHQRSRDETHGMLRDMNSKLDRLVERMMK
jgi:uncharacterized FlaG/YvyC family protein